MVEWAANVRSPWRIPVSSAASGVALSAPKKAGAARATATASRAGILTVGRTRIAVGRVAVVTDLASLDLGVAAHRAGVWAGQQQGTRSAEEQETE
jgi:hypothetical protein